MGGNSSKLPEFQSQMIDNTREDESKILRSLHATKDGFVDTFKEKQTLYPCWEASVQAFPDRDCFGVRQVDANGEAGDFAFESYATVSEKVNQIASGLVKLGCEQGANIGLYSINRPEWVMSELACYRQNFVGIPLYDTLGEEAIEYITSQAEINYVVCSADKIEKLLHVSAKTEYINYIISMDDLSDDVKAQGEESGVTIVDLKSVMEQGKENMVDASPAESPDSIATICYTSGTTGNPKGVVLSHSSFCGMLGSITIHGVEVFETDVHISYLPLAHVFERAVMTIVYSSGASAGFFQGEIPKLFDDIHTLRPTFFPSVPRLFNRLYDKINMAFADFGGVKKWMFDTGLEAKTNALSDGTRESAIWDAVLFNKIKDKLGGRVRFIITGSAPLSSTVQDFLQCCFCCPVIQGYGLTETCAASTATLFDDTASGHVGVPLACCEVTLRDVPDMDYLHTDDPPRGEVMIRGVNVFSGYYKNPEKTAEELEEDGWFHTGDIGQINPNGTLSIIDRKKNLFKLAQGEYIAPEKVEGALGKNPYVLQIFVTGNSLESRLVAVVVPDPETLLPWASQQGMENADDLAALCQSDDVKKFIASEIKSTGQAANLRGFEFPHALHLEPEPFSVENEILTPTFKLKRKVAQDNYAEQIEEMYAAIHAADDAKNKKK